MKRRDFLKAGIAAGAALALPVAAAQRSVVSWFEENFDCRMGEPSAYVEGPKGKTIYDTYKTIEPSHAKAAHNFLTHFKELLHVNPELRGTRLYWRLSEKVQFTKDRGFDEYFDVTADGGLEPRVVWRPLRYGVRTRIALPKMTEAMHYKVNGIRYREGAMESVELQRQLRDAELLASKSNGLLNRSKEG